MSLLGVIVIAEGKLVGWDAHGRFSMYKVRTYSTYDGKVSLVSIHEHLARTHDFCGWLVEAAVQTWSGRTNHVTLFHYQVSLFIG